MTLVHRWNIGDSLCTAGLFIVFPDTKGRSLCQAFLAETVETGTKNRSLGKIKFRAFPKRVGARILSLESIDYFGTSEHY